jgi:hypothetical protein
LEITLTLSDGLALCALVVASFALIQSWLFWRKSFRPIITAMVSTHAAGSEAIAFNLVILNSGTIPARDVTLHIHDNRRLNSALNHAPEDQRQKFLACFEKENAIPVIHNGAHVSCSFGFTGAHEGFWKPMSTFPIWIRYYGWFGSIYCEEQIIKIADTSNFTNKRWK